MTDKRLIGLLHFEDCSDCPHWDHEADECGPYPDGKPRMWTDGEGVYCATTQAQADLDAYAAKRGWVEG